MLEAVLDHDHDRGNTPTPTSTSKPPANPALGAVLWFARSDGDATVRCSAFDTVARYVGEPEAEKY